jgi:hypothetical protein
MHTKGTGNRQNVLIHNALHAANLPIRVARVFIAKIDLYPHGIEMSRICTMGRPIGVRFFSLRILRYARRWRELHICDCCTKVRNITGYFEPSYERILQSQKRNGRLGSYFSRSFVEDRMTARGRKPRFCFRTRESTCCDAANLGLRPLAAVGVDQKLLF